jgi:hypothetical protein
MDMIKKIKNLLSKFPAAYFLSRMTLFWAHKQVARWVPDRPFLRLQYFFRLGRFLSLNNPTLFNEKIQWLKLNFRNPLLHKCVDKWEVREFVRNKGLAEILIPTFGVYENVGDIDSNRLPTQFVLKLTNGSGFNVICLNKALLNWREVARYFDAWKTVDFFAARREWAYKDVRNRVVCEQLIRAADGALPNDYRFFCFHGRVEFVAVDLDSVVDGQKTSNYFRHLYSRDWQPLKATIQYPAKPNYEVVRPARLELMIQIAERLAEDFPAVRVDLYDSEGRIYFGELTFYHASGYQKIRPRIFEEYLGSLLDLSRLG